MEGLRALYAYPGLNQRNEGNRESVGNHFTLCFAGVWPWHSAISQSLADVLLPPTSLLSCVLLIMLSSLGSRLCDQLVALPLWRINSTSITRMYCSLS